MAYRERVRVRRDEPGLEAWQAHLGILGHQTLGGKRADCCYQENPASRVTDYYYYLVCSDYEHDL